MSTSTGGRPKGSKNKAGHAAGGSRPGAGRSKKVVTFGSSGDPTDSDNTHNAQPSTKKVRVAGPGEDTASIL